MKKLYYLHKLVLSIRFYKLNKGLIIKKLILFFSLDINHYSKIMKLFLEILVILKKDRLLILKKI